MEVVEGSVREEQCWRGGVLGYFYDVRGASEEDLQGMHACVEEGRASAATPSHFSMATIRTGRGIHARTQAPESPGRMASVLQQREVKLVLTFQ